MWSHLGEDAPFQGHASDAGGAPKPLGVTGRTHKASSRRRCLHQCHTGALRVALKHLSGEPQAGGPQAQTVPAENSVVPEDDRWLLRMISELLVPDSRYEGTRFQRNTDSQLIFLSWSLMSHCLILPVSFFNVLEGFPGVPTPGWPWASSLTHPLSPS